MIETTYRRRVRLTWSMTNKHKALLLERLEDVAKISIEPRYVFVVALSKLYPW